MKPAARQGKQEKRGLWRQDKAEGIKQEFRDKTSLGCPAGISAAPQSPDSSGKGEHS